MKVKKITKKDFNFYNLLSNKKEDLNDEWEEPINSTYFNIFEKDISSNIKDSLSNLLKNIEKERIVFLCIGTDRCIGDCFGPLVGENLKNKTISNPIYGTLENPIHAMNLVDTIESIKEDYDNPFIIAIDAALGDITQIDNICLKDSGIYPGKGVGKDLPKVGDIAITGITNFNIPGFSELDTIYKLQSTRLYNVMKMATLTSDIIFSYFEEPQIIPVELEEVAITE